jgi:hypothetical protein
MTNSIWRERVNETFEKELRARAKMPDIAEAAPFTKSAWAKKCKALGLEKKILSGHMSPRDKRTYVDPVGGVQIELEERSGEGKQVLYRARAMVGTTRIASLERHTAGVEQSFGDGHSPNRNDGLVMGGEFRNLGDDVLARMVSLVQEGFGPLSLASVPELDSQTFFATLTQKRPDAERCLDCRRKIETSERLVLRLVSEQEKHDLGFKDRWPAWAQRAVLVGEMHLSCAQKRIPDVFEQAVSYSGWRDDGYLAELL